MINEKTHNKNVKCLSIINATLNKQKTRRLANLGNIYL